ncbi:hypothetical protein LJR225_002305 [Phenylobacterium sp. LjRoot225]|uniref:hypothetical protein n=1 Tax=Phenylobacterium sp. LjRoot225 TaxID=3342285 RepID=UPI003ECD84B3
MDFIDISGASGTAYRFRRWPSSGAHPPIAGNFVLVAERTRKVVAIGVLDDLSRARQELDALPRGTALFTRLNVARRVREAEHADLALQHPDASGNVPVGLDSVEAA